VVSFLRHLSSSSRRARGLALHRLPLVPLPTPFLNVAYACGRVLTTVGASGSYDGASIKALVADLVGRVVEEVGKLAEHLGLEVQLLLLLAPVVNGVLQMFQSVVHIVVKVLKSVERLVVALVNDMPEVRHAKRAETAEDGRGVEVGNERVLRRLIVGGLRVAVVALPVLNVLYSWVMLVRVVVGGGGPGDALGDGGVRVDLLGGGDAEAGHEKHQKLHVAAVAVGRAVGRSAGVNRSGRGEGGAPSSVRFALA